MSFEDVKARHAVMWGSAPYERVSEGLRPMHEHLLAAIGAHAGEQWLDVATGTGELAVPAALGGANVVGLDLAPRLIEAAELRAAEAGATLRFDVGDAERLPYDDASFDIVTSSVGAIFAPDHAAVARELARVTRPGGTLGLTAWLPGPGVQDVFALTAPFAPAPPPPGAGSPFAWGDPQYVEELLGDAFDLGFETGNAPAIASSGDEMWQLFSSCYGPTKAVADALPTQRRAELEQSFVSFYEQQHRTAAGIAQPRPYLLVVGTRK